MTKKITDSEQSRRTFVKGTVAAGAGVAGLASLGTAAAQDIQDLTAFQAGQGVVVVQVQVTDAVDIESIDITLIQLDDSEINVVRNVANNNRIAIPIQVSGNQVGANVAVTILGESEQALDQDSTTVSRQRTQQA